MMKSILKMENQIVKILKIEAAPYRLGFRKDSIEEILPFPTVTRVPNTSDSVCGLMGYRGNPITIINLIRHLGLSEEIDVKPHQVLLIRSSGGIVGFGISGACELISGKVSEIQPVSKEIAFPNPEMLEGIIQVEGHEVLLLNAFQIMKSGNIVRSS